MIWFRFIHYALIFQSIFALLGTSRLLSPKNWNDQVLSCHNQISNTKKDTLPSAIGSDTSNFPSITAAASSTNVHIQQSEALKSSPMENRNARIGAAIALVLLIIQV